MKIRCEDLIRAVLALLASCALAACGGGGGGGGGGDNGGGGGNSSRGTISISPATLTFDAIANSNTTIGPQPITATVTGVNSGTLYLVVSVTGDAVGHVGDIQINGTTSGTANVYPISQYQMTPGQHHGTITVVACTSSPTCATGRLSGSGQTIEVTYNVAGLVSTASSLSFDVRDAPLPADFTRSFTVTGYPVQTWTATSTAPWLQVTPANNSTSAATTITASLVESELDKMISGGYSAEILLTPAQAETIRVPVNLGIMRTQVNFVAPYVERANKADDVVIRGENFQKVTATGLRFGSIDAESFTVVSDTEIRARHPALPAGEYPVHLVNTENFDRTRARLVVQNDPAHAPLALNYPGTDRALLHSLVYDAERRAIMVSYYDYNRTTDVHRFVRFSAASDWAVDASRSAQGFGAFTLTPDGTQVLLAADGLAPNAGNPINVFAVHSLDPVTLQTQFVTLDPQLNLFEARSMAVSNDGQALIGMSRIMFSNIKRYSMLRPVIDDFRNPQYPISLDDAEAVASGNGSTVLLVQGFSNTGGNAPVKIFDVNTHTLSDAPLVTRGYWASLNRTGSRLLVETRVYDRDWTLLGNLPDSSRIGVLSPTAMRAYTLDQDGTLRRFDLDGTPVNGEFPEILPAIVPVQDPDATHITVWKMLVTPDEGAVIVAGGSNVVLVPLP